MNFERLLASLLVVLSVHSAHIAIAEDKVPAPSPQWKEKMHVLYKTLDDVMTDASSETRFDAPENRYRVDNNAKKLASFAHDLTRRGMVAPDADPTVPIIAAILQDQTKLAVSALKSGNRHYARTLLRGTTGYCIACHTRNGSGPSFVGLDLSPSTSKLSSFERGAFFAATRQYDRAITTFTQVLDDSQATSRPLEWEQAMERTIEIAVRVKSDPDLALGTVQKILTSDHAPFFIKKDALEWKKSILKWKDELPRRVLTEAGLFAEAQRLVAEAHEVQKYPADHSGDIHYLRASAVLHELLQKYPEANTKAEALLLEGICYEAIDPSDVVDIHEFYYQSCIRQAPHTTTAESCYARYEQSVYNGYTGSAGTFLPDEVVERLNFLKATSLPESGFRKQN